MAKSAPDAPPMLSISDSVISGGSFTQFSTQSGTKGGFDYLKEAVASAAFHNSGERFDAPRCHPKTRIAVLKKIMDWIHGQDPETSNALIMWLRGAAGAGKSAIAQTIAELCHEELLLLASFFFGRSDPTRNHGRSLIATIAYQICSISPSVRGRITRTIEDDPLIFSQSLFTQISVLVVQPLQDLFQAGQFSGPTARRFIVIDGLDECLDVRVQCNILDTILKAIHQLHVPLIFLIASRSEPDISAVFHGKEMMGILTEISLDDLYLKDINEDIELFLRDTFKEIVDTHRFKKFIPTPWPAEEVIQRLVRKSSGQFIYAATVAKYVQSNRHRPDHRLEVVLSLRPARTGRPFAELDALYTQIFISVEDIDRVLDVLAFSIQYNLQNANLDDSKFSLSGINVKDVETILALDHGDIQLLFCDLGSVVAFVDVYGNGSEELRLLHASLTDFLLDPSRSNQFHVDIASKCTMYARRCIQHLQSMKDDEPESALHMAMLFLPRCLETSQPTAELRDDILSFSIDRIYKFRSSRTIASFNQFFSHQFLRCLANLKFEDADHLYNRHLQLFDEILTRHLEIYYADIRLTLLVALVDFIRAKGIWNEVYISMRRFQEPFQLFDIDPGLLDTDGRRCTFLENGFPEYFELISEFFEDTGRSGSYALNGERYANAALCCLMYICDHFSIPQTLGRRYTKHDIKTRRHRPWIWRTRRGKRGVLEKSRSWHKKKDENIYCKLKHPILSFSHMTNPTVVEGVWAEKYSFGLEYVIYFLPRSTRSEELIKFASQHTLASRSQEFPKLSRKARKAINSYLGRMESESL